MSEYLVTILTPTFNRAAYLPRLYQSLLDQQGNVPFEWLVVDDGSTDETASLVASFAAESDISIVYRHQENSGKHIAINTGVQSASGELILIVDSDDYLNASALLAIGETWASVRSGAEAERFGGICLLRQYADGRVIGGEVDFETLDVSSFDFFYRRGYRGDKAEVYRTAVLKEFPFPEIAGENFCTEALVWNRIAKTYVMRFVNRKVYVCEYLPGGLSDRSFELRKDNPRYACLYYSEFLTYDAAFPQRLRAAINYWRFARYDTSRSFVGKCAGLKTNWWAILLSPIGFFMSFNVK